MNCSCFRQGIQRRQWHPTPVLLPGKSHGRRSLVGCSPWGCEESGHDWATSLSLFTFMHWRRKWQPTLVFLPGESQGRRSLVGCLVGSQSQTWLKQLSSSRQGLCTCVCIVCREDIMLFTLPRNTFPTISSLTFTWLAYSIQFISSERYSWLPY